MRFGFLIGTAAAVFAACAPALASGQSADQQSSAPAPAEDWTAIAKADVLAAYDIYVANHPGMHDPLNRAFPEQLKRARDAALARAESVTDRQGYVEALGAFSAELSDGHAQVMAKPVAGTKLTERLWPGFVPAWRGKMIVHHAAPASPAPVGSEIVSCDGLPVREVVRRRLIAGSFRPNEEGHWWARTPHAFTAFEGFAEDRPETCLFRTPDGQEREAKLGWAKAPDNHAALLTLATDGERTPIGLTEPRPGMFLIGMPDFQPNEEGVKAYGALNEALEARQAELGRARAIIIDLRHNNGGSSSWSRNAAKALFGEEPVETAMEDYYKDVRIWWRASEGNTAYMAEMEEYLRGVGNEEVADAVNTYGKGMQAALAAGEPFYVAEEEEEEAPAPRVASTFKTPVYVIVPGRCASACLDALDTFTQFPNVKLIGAPSSGDSTYMEVRSQDLPSGHGRIVIPNKIWVGRPRGSGEVYRPAIEVTDPDWSTATFLDVVEKDLAASR